MEVVLFYMVLDTPNGLCDNIDEVFWGVMAPG